MIDILDNLDRAFENRIRLVIMSSLVARPSLNFRDLKALIGATDGNLATHLKSLERVGYIGVRKSFVKRKPNTQYSATKLGLRAFRKHVSALEKIISSGR